MSNETIYAEAFAAKFPSINLEEYFTFIEQNRLPVKQKSVTHAHHVLPQWAFPEYKDFNQNIWNQVHLSIKDHFIAHLILWKNWKHEKNAHPVLRFINFKFNLEVIENLSEEDYSLYAAAKHHRNAVQNSMKGRAISAAHRENLIIAARNRKPNSHVTRVDIEQGKKVKIQIEEYENNKQRYAGISKGKPAWNKGVKGYNSGFLQVYVKLTGDKQFITSEEYRTNKELYIHPSTGKTGSPGTLQVRNKLTGETSRIECTEYEAHRDIYEFTSCGKKWYNNGEINLRFSYNDQIPEGFVSGRKPNSLKGFKKSIATCPHCGKTGGQGNLIRYHFDRCKLKK